MLQAFSQLLTSLFLELGRELALGPELAPGLDLVILFPSLILVVLSPLFRARLESTLAGSDGRV